MIIQTMQRYGPEAIHQAERFEELVRHRCKKAGQPAPTESDWRPLREGWMRGWPTRASDAFWKRYHGLRAGLIRKLGEVNIDPWLAQLPQRTVMPPVRAEVEIGSLPGRQPQLAEALARLDWGGKLVIEEPKTFSRKFPEGELTLVGAGDSAVPLELHEAKWRGGHLLLENLEIRGNLHIKAGLVELKRCRLISGAKLHVIGAGAVLALEDCEMHGTIDAEPATVVSLSQCSWDQAPLALVSSGLVHFQGVACSDHTQAAVRLRQGARALLEDCQLRDCGIGLQIGGTARVWLSQSWIRNNRVCGVSLQDQARLEAQGCHFRGNKGDGLVLHDKSQLHLRVSNLQDNTGAGVRYGAQAELDQASNQFNNNGRGNFLQAEL